MAPRQPSHLGARSQSVEHCGLPARPHYQENLRGSQSGRRSETTRRHQRREGGRIEMPRRRAGPIAASARRWTGHRCLVLRWSPRQGRRSRRSADCRSFEEPRRANTGNPLLGDRRGHGRALRFRPGRITRQVRHPRPRSPSLSRWPSGSRATWVPCSQSTTRYPAPALSRARTSVALLESNR